MILFIWIEFVKYNLYHEMDEMVYVYTISANTIIMKITQKKN